MGTTEKKLDRSQFIKGAAVVGAAVTLGSAFKALSSLAASEGPTSVEKGEWKPTTCQGCTSWCAVQVYVEGGRAIKIRGNPNSKVNLGNCCSKSHLALQQVYDPDRLKTPMKRTNPNKGRNEDPQFVPISWDEALGTIADQIMALRAAGETHKYMLMRGRYSYMRDILYDRMTKIIGSPNNISHSAICAEAEKFGPYYTEGEWDYRQYDVKNANYVLLWGADPLSANRQVSYYLSQWGDLMDRATITVVDPRLSATAAKADNWLPIIPGQDSALAVALAHVILTEGLWHKEFVGDFADGENLFVAHTDDKPFVPVPEDAFVVPLGHPDKEGLRHPQTHGLVKWWNIELKDRTPEWAAKLTGLSAEQIRNVAIGFGKAAPHSICWVGGGPSMQVRGGYGSMAAHALNGLVGSVDNVGGTMKANKVHTMDFPDIAKEHLDDIAKAGKQWGKDHGKIDHRGRLKFPAIKKGKPGSAVVTNNAAVGIINEDPNEIKVAIAYMNNFAFSCPQTERWERALAKIPFLVHITTHAAEFTHFADIVLPSTHTMFEKWGYVKSHANGYRHVTMLQPVIEPVWDVKIDETEIPWALAEKLAERGFTNLLDHYKTYKDPETGKSPTNEKEFALYALKYATQKLWDPAQHAGGDKFEGGWDEFKKVGVSNSDPYPYRARWGNMKTETKGFEFYSETLKLALEGHAKNHNTTVDEVLKVCYYDARGEQAFVPHYEEPLYHGNAEEFPFLLVDYKSRLNREGRTANCPWYQELKDFDPGDVPWDDVAKINPIDAKKIGVKDGDKIKLTSETGELECTIKFWEGARPGTIAKCYGQGHWAYGKVAALKFGKTPRGGNNNAIIPADYDRLSGSTAFYGMTRVKVTKA